MPADSHSGPSRKGLRLVSIDHRSAARAIGGIAFAGARRPAVVSLPLTRDRVSRIASGVDIGEVTFPGTRARLTGYREAAAQVGIDRDDVPVAVCGRNDVEEAERLATQLLTSEDRPDAIAAMSDQQAAGVVWAAGVAGCDIPSELALTGWDDVPTETELGLTTVAQSLRGQGKACAYAALGEDPGDFSSSWSVIRRGSTR